MPVPVQQVVMHPHVPSTARLTGSITIPKTSVVMESHGVEQRVPKYEYDIRTVNCPKTVQVEKQILELVLVAVQLPSGEAKFVKLEVPKIIVVPQTVIEERYIKIPKPIYETKQMTRKVPRMVYDDEVYETTEQVMETKLQSVAVPRTVSTYETVPQEDEGGREEELG
eukprot:CAMPEP_0181347300 /NCGR_PEP_ID=MMETSP1101-20121128/33807_1 /TAXON_ID=46948 /ORGANISM="Rhodomonas abbreviata, Strain Caron Lab Isolate" /LENGTH=167 /DNA_ID=CAMNT_0023459509 /DNA_START=149 /DNA_END=649 /DNA_ORIENTATION=+